MAPVSSEHLGLLCGIHILIIWSNKEAGNDLLPEVDQEWLIKWLFGKVL